MNTKKKYFSDCSEHMADMLTPVAVFQKVRAHYENSTLLESSDYNSRESSRSFLCFDALESITLDKNVVSLWKKEIGTEKMPLREKKEWKLSYQVSF